MSLNIFIIYHKQLNEGYIFNDYIENSETNNYVNDVFVYYGVNNIFSKTIIPRKNNYLCKQILEYNLPVYNPFFQKRGFMETSAYLHVYKNNLHKNLDFVGFCQYDMTHKQLYKNLDKNTIYLLPTGGPIVQNGCWHKLMFNGIRNIDYLLDHYNKYFGKQYSIQNLEGIVFSLWQTNIYPVRIFEKLAGWLELLVEDCYPWSVSPPYEIHWGVAGGYTERAIGLFNAIEIIEGIQYQSLNMEHYEICEKLQYSQKGFLNFFDMNITTQFLKNITNYQKVPKLNFSMFNAMYQSTNGDRFYMERAMTNSKNGLIKTNDQDNNCELLGFNIEAEDPRLISVKGVLYVVFICLSPYSEQKRCIAISRYDVFEPVFLRVCEPTNPRSVTNTLMNVIEKNWAPFVKDDTLYFVYNYDPLIIIKYDFNQQGFCDIVFKQNSVSMPFNTTHTILRGGSNLVPYKDGIYLGGCHSRFSIGNRFYHYTHMILLDTNNWKIVYLSKPLAYLYLNNDLPKLEKANILLGTNKNSLHNYIIQDPISLNATDHSEKYLLTINIADNTTLLYELELGSSISLSNDEKEVGYWNKQVALHNLVTTF